MKLIVYKNIPCPIILKKEPDTFFILFKDEQKWIFECSQGYGEIEKDGNGVYYLFNCVCHREYGPAIEFSNGGKQWYKNGKLHREDGPALERSIGGKKWYQNGLLHREDGHAIEHGNGKKQWFIKNIEYSEEEYFKKIEEMKRYGTYNL